MNAIALITGGSRGLGKTTALALAQQGTDIILTYRSNQKAAQQVVKEIVDSGCKAVALPLDLSQTESIKPFALAVEQALKRDFGGNHFNYLINNAGIGVQVPFMETTEAQFDEMMNVHLKGSFFITQALLPYMTDGGRIINFSSGLARFSLPGFSAYAMMKGGIEVLTRYLAKELGNRQIRVNTVAPGAIETDFGGGAVRDNDQLNQQIASQTALGRVGLPADIGQLVALLVNEGAGWVNGQRIEASGGIFL